jgi:hypothetical protein
MKIIVPIAKNGRTAEIARQSSIQIEAVSPPRDEGFCDAEFASRNAESRQRAVTARCATRVDVQTALRTASSHGLAVRVRSGASHVGHGLNPGELVVDLSAMRHVAVDPITCVATVAGGATVNDVVIAAAGHGLVPITGNSGAVSMASLLSSGGYGPLLGRYGLAVDNVLEAEIVLKNGQQVIANAERSSAFFQALRGGRTDLGVVTSLQVRLRTLSSLLAGMIFYDLSEADLVLRGYSAIAASAPEEFTVAAGIAPAANGNPLLFIAPAWCGEIEKGARVLAALRSFGNPLAANVGPMDYADLLAMYDRHLARGSNYSIRRRWLSKLSGRAISAMIVAANARTSPLSAVVLHHFHGAATRMNSAPGTFSLRSQHFMLEVIANWERTEDDHGAGHRLWAENLSDGIVAGPVALR